MEDQIKYRQSQGLENPSNSQLSAKISDQYSNTSRKRVGSIMVKKNNAQNSDEQQLYMKQVGKIKRGSYSSNRNYTEPLHIQEQNEVQYKNKLMKMKSDLKKINSNDLANKINSRALHSRNKSYLQQKLELQKQLHNVLTKRSKLEQLQTKKIRLRAKLSELQFKLSEIKDAKQINKMSLGMKNRDIDSQNTFDQKNPQAQANLTKKLKKPKLRPLPLNLRKPIESKIKLNTQPDLNNRGESDEQETIDYYYPAQLNHKCLNCKHFALKVEDVGLSNERIDQIIQVIKQGP